MLYIITIICGISLVLAIVLQNKEPKIEIEDWEEEISDITFENNVINFFIQNDDEIWVLDSVDRDQTYVRKSSEIDKPVLKVKRTAKIYDNGYTYEEFKYEIILPLN